MRVLRDVVVDRTSADELLALSRVPGIVGEQMSVDLLGAGARLRLQVTVLDSRPLIVDGALRHRLRLAVVMAQGQDDAAAGAGDCAPIQAN